MAKSNYRVLESAWRVHVQPVWGPARIADVDLAAVERWIAAMKQKSGATTVIRAYGVLAGILDDAVKARRLAANPARGVENLPNKSAKRRVYLTAEDVGRLAGESGDHRVLVLTLAFTGIRWGEAVALRVSDVQFLKRRLLIHDNAVQLGVDHAVGETKGREERSVPVPQFVLDELSVQATVVAATILCSATASTSFPGRSRRVAGSPGASTGQHRRITGGHRPARRSSTGSAASYRCTDGHPEAVKARGVVGQCVDRRDP